MSAAIDNENGEEALRRDLMRALSEKRKVAGHFLLVIYEDADQADDAGWYSYEQHPNRVALRGAVMEAIIFGTLRNAED